MFVVYLPVEGVSACGCASMYLCVFACWCLYVYVFVHVYVCISVHVCLCVCVPYICIRMCVCVCLRVFVCIGLYVFMSACVSFVRMSMYMYVCVSVEDRAMYSLTSIAPLTSCTLRAGGGVYGYRRIKRQRATVTPRVRDRGQHHSVSDLNFLATADIASPTRNWITMLKRLKVGSLSSLVLIQ